MASTPNDTVLLRIISNTSGTFEFAVELDGAVGETRALLEAQMLGDTGTNRVKMTFRGVVLEKDDLLWRGLAPKPGESMYAVITASKTVAPTAIPAGMGLGGNANNTMSSQAQMMEPMIDSMVSNPGFVDMMIAMSPELKEMVAKNPDVKRQLQNPEMMKLMLRSQYDPMARREVDRALTSQMAQLNSIPGGMAMLERAMGNMLQEERYAPKTAADRKMATEENARPQPGQTANSLEAPNPWARATPQQRQPVPIATPPFNSMGPLPMHNPFMPMFPASGMFGQTGMPPFVQSAAAGASAPPQQPAVGYSSQKAILRDMGFEDEALMSRALAASKGDIDGAIAFIDAEQNS